jgi:hypothetical protein
MLYKMVILLLFNLIFGIGHLRSDNRFSLPSDKTSAVNCQDAVLTRHQGKITSEKMIHFPAGNFEIHLEVNDKDAVDWLVICDGVTGKILRDFKLDEEK